MLRSTFTCLIVLACHCALAADEPFELRDGDRVIFLGNSFFERAIDYGVIETAWSVRWPDRNVSFRNLGWDGDTVYGHSRAGGRRRAVFGDAEEGFQRLVEHVKSLKPTMVVLAYGFNESFEGADGVLAFEVGLRRLVNELSGDGIRFVFFSAVPLQPERGPKGSLRTVVEKHIRKRNQQLVAYNAVIEKLARDRKCPFVDLFTPLLQSDKILTENGIHLNRLGYERIAEATAEQLKLPPPKIVAANQLERIRHAVSKKNRLYFHRWRPRNDAFVYGERKDEQKIAQVEPEKFEPFIAKQEEAIRGLLQ